MKKRSWMIGFLLSMSILFGGLAGCSQTPENPSTCFPSDPFSLPSPIGEWGQDNLAYLNLNTFDGLTFMVNQYDVNGNWISDPPEGTTLLSNKGQDGSFCSGSFHTKQRKARMTITLGENPQLDGEHLKQFFCLDAVRELLNKYQDGEQGMAALVDLKTCEVVPLQKSVSRFRLGNYEVECEYRITEVDGEQRGEFHVIATYQE